ncbi:MAG TPA: class II glutamine amidotransferase [Ignavibacteria bacterium]|nr:class II glutamine amidotransferase [Bacteroidota bacterium]HRI84029.1 class II glutamine amidotransferase [Ignavibacteria bacterium]HRJ99557.1 class II glutamine amidotransferase [Ignavibacteria bacterium]
MCRWLAYTGGPILMSELLIKPKHNLIHQSIHAKEQRFPVNGDGYGLGWYDKQPYPGLFRSIRPAWNDMNLHNLASHIESPLFMSHVRASSLAPVQETNCHPFRYNTWLFMHNGQIAQFEFLRQKLLSLISPEYFNDLYGSTDSEVMFYLALTYGLEENVTSAISKMVKVIKSEGMKVNVSGDLWMSLAISDGKSLWGFRYGSVDSGPSLYISPSVEELSRLNPNIEDKFGDFAACLVSEPIGNYQETWREVPDNSVIEIRDENITINSFIVA